MTEYIDVSIDVFMNAEEKAKVRADVTVQELMNIIVTEFNCSESSLYELVQKGANTVLETHKTLLENGIQSNEKLIFQYARNHSTSTDVPEGAVIIEDTQNRIYPIQWQPAIIGRKSMGTTEQNKLLAVDLYWLLDSRRLSRSHAQITEKNGAWFIQRLSDRSGVRVDGIDLEQEQKVALRNGSKITLGNQISKLTFQTL